MASALNTAGEGPGRTNVSAGPSPESLGRIADLLATGSLKLPISASYDLADAPTALADLGAKPTQVKLAVGLG